MPENTKNTQNTPNIKKNKIQINYRNNAINKTQESTRGYSEIPQIQEISDILKNTTKIQQKY